MKNLMFIDVNLEFSYSGQSKKNNIDIMFNIRAIQGEIE